MADNILPTDESSNPDETQPNLPSDSSIPEPPATDEAPAIIGSAIDPKKESARNIITTIAILFAAPLIAIFLITFVFQSYQVDGPSMETTLQNEDRLIINKIPRTLSRITGNAYMPHRGDIIIFVERAVPEISDSTPRQLIKRVIGLPGDRVVVSKGIVTIYNTDHPKGYQPDENSRWSKAIITTPGEVDVTVAKNEVFVNGDNRTNSLDSRYFGPVPVTDIVGKLTYRIFPIKNAESF